MEKVDIFIPKEPGAKGAGSLFVSVNGKHYSIMRGIKVSVPIEVKEVIEASERASEEAERFIRGNASV